MGGYILNPNAYLSYLVFLYKLSAEGYSRLEKILSSNFEPEKRHTVKNLFGKFL